MTFSEINQPNPLNERRKEGMVSLKKEWNNLYSENDHHALALINDGDLEFPTLYVLREDIKEKKCQHLLIERNQLALHHIENILHETNLGIAEHKHFSDQHYVILSSFRWMLDTGAAASLNNGYIKVIDGAVIQMLLTYQQNIAKDVVDLIFRRKRSHQQSHYLLCALQENADPNCLFYIANYLLSNNQNDVLFAAKLLHFIPGMAHAATKPEAVALFEGWMEDNHRYLVYTGETSDVSPMPRPYKVNLAAKYLGKPVSLEDGESLQSLSNKEKERWQQFSQLTDGTKEQLASLSAHYRQNHRNEWYEWMASPLEQHIALLDKGGIT
ncbi:hypothetical protein EV207_11834 [Scopulibacillus darangshiensis]|uniref:Uncharacterized protein n=1 Tax=Scopulibacillus darangshiensis TaxID=442528 RepID=A0A4V2SMF3_9BACL|nr:hypothetical protein [Scopulibacillus darangshiensis]TCP27056.1 hypothetical protein EV207_11834 [Scopulibacillus darangshiensis]